MEILELDTPMGKINVSVVCVFEVEEKNCIAVIPTNQIGTANAEILIYGYDNDTLYGLSDDDYEKASTILEEIIENQDEAEQISLDDNAIEMLIDNGTFNNIIEGYCRIVLDELGLSEKLKNYSFEEMFKKNGSKEAIAKYEQSEKK